MKLIFAVIFFSSESDAGTYTAKAISGIENVTCSAQLAVGQGKYKIGKMKAFLFIILPEEK